MKKLSLIILYLLNENNAVSPLGALSVKQILELIEEKQRRSRSTTYRHLCKMKALGYLKCGLDDGIGSTYYISESGKVFLQNAN